MVHFFFLQSDPVVQAGAHLRHVEEPVRHDISHVALHVGQQGPELDAAAHEHRVSGAADTGKFFFFFCYVYECFENTVLFRVEKIGKLLGQHV